MGMMAITMHVGGFTLMQKSLVVCCCLVLCGFFRNQWSFVLVYMGAFAVGAYLSRAVLVRQALFQTAWIVPCIDIIESVVTKITDYLNNDRCYKSNALDSERCSHTHVRVPKTQSSSETGSRTFDNLKKRAEFSNGQHGIKIPPLQAMPDAEASIIVNLIVRDFVRPWYKTLSEDEQCEENITQFIRLMIENIFSRIKEVDKYKFAKSCVDLYRSHLSNVQSARDLLKQRPHYYIRQKDKGTSLKKLRSLTDAFEHLGFCHRECRTDEDERIYLRAAVDVFLRKLLPSDVYECSSGSYCLTDIVSSNVLHFVVDLICQPDFLHRAIISILSDEELQQVDDDSECDESHRSNHSKYTLPAEKTSQIQLVSIAHKTTEQEESYFEPNTSRSPNPQVDSNSPMCIGDNGCTEIYNQLGSRSDAKHLHDILLSERRIGRASSHASVHSKHSTSQEAYVTENLAKFFRVATSPEVGNMERGSDLERDHTTEVRSEVTDPEKESLYSLISSDSDGASLHSCGSFENIDERGQSHSATFYIPGDTVDDLMPSGPACVEREQAEGMSVPRSPHIDRNLLEERCAKGHLDYCDRKLKPQTQDSHLGGSDLHLGDRTQTAHANVCQEAPFKPHLVKGHKSNTSQANSLLNPQRNRLLVNSMNTQRVAVDELSESLALEEGADVLGQMESAVGETPRTLFEDIRISSAETAKEPGATVGEYILYCIQVLAWHQHEAGTWALEKSLVKRRYREFLTLQERLEDHPNYKKSMKGVTGLRWWKRLPLGSLVGQKVERRRLFLEGYLKNLSSMEDIGHSMAMREFLAYEGDANIAFVRKASEVPRIDRVLVKTVSGVFDKLTSVLPSLPEDKKGPRPSSGVRVQAQQSQAKEECDWVDSDALHIEFSFVEDRVDIVNELSRVLERSVMKEPDSDGDPEADSISCSSSERQAGDGCEVELLKTGEPKVETSDVPLASAVVDLAVQLLHGRDAWVKGHAVVQTFTTTVGVALESWLHRELDEVTTGERCAHYLGLLREAVWPEGHLDAAHRKEASKEQQDTTKEQARRCILSFLPGVLPYVIGRPEFGHCVEQILSSIQDPVINRQLAYRVLDLLLEILIPEIATSQLSGHTELLQGPLQKHQETGSALLQ